MNTNTMMSYSEAVTLIHRALNALSNVCDGAHAHDKTGFNGSDSRWGKQMAASNPVTWSARCTYLLARMIQKYAKQLAGMGVDISALPDMSTPELVSDLRSESSAPSMSYGQARSMAVAQEPAKPKATRKVSGKGDGFFRVDFPYDPEIVAAVKELPYKCREFCSDDTGKYWLVNFRIDTMEIKGAALLFWRWAMQNQFEIDAKSTEIFAGLAGEAIQKEDAMKAQAEMATAVDADILIPNITGELRPFQRGGVAYAVKAKRTFIADEMGLGKTVQALATCEHENAYPALVVCRASLRQGWAREVKNFFPHRKVSMSPFDKQSDIVVVSHRDLVQGKDDLIARGFKALIGDECQDFKGFKSQRTKAMKEIAKRANPAYRMLLSGTPLENRPSELIPQLEILGRLDDFGGFKKYAYRYCSAFQGSFGFEMGGASNTAELHAKLKATCYIRRLKDQVLKELPPKVRDVIEVEISNKAEYAKCERDVLASLERAKANFADERVELESTLNTMDAQALLNYIEETWPTIRKKALIELRDKGRDGIMGFIAAKFTQRENSIENARAIMLMGRMMEVAALGKIEAFKEWYADFDGGKIVVFARSVAVQEALAAAFPNFIYTRASKWENSQEAVDAFKNTDAPGIICSLKGDNAGLNGMQCAQYGVFIDMDFVPATHLQAEDRLHRIGQIGSVNWYYFHGKNTIDAATWGLLKGKWQIMEAILDGKVIMNNKASIADELLEALAA